MDRLDEIESAKEYFSRKHGIPKDKIKIILGDVKYYGNQINNSEENADETE